MKRRLRTDIDSFILPPPVQMFTNETNKSFKEQQKIRKKENKCDFVW